MHALIDADRLAYSIGGMKNNDGRPAEWSFIRARIDGNLLALKNATSADKITLFLTPSDKSNFRFPIATIRPYKGQRPTEKPHWYEAVRQYLLLTYPCVMESGIEADDAIGIVQYANILNIMCQKDSNNDIEETIIVSVDKDLDNIPGYHYNEIHPEKGIYWVSEIDSLRNFYCQLIVGDSIDNIGGLHGVGGKSKLLSHIRRASTELDMYVHVRKLYEKYFGNYWKLFLWENASLLWIKRVSEPQGEKEVLERLENLERQRLELLELEVA